jgi:hypothetical protein
VGHTGTTGEWGYGIDVEGSSTVSVHDIGLSNCWGDGMVVSATGSGSTAVLSTGVTINRVTSTNNRRQGLTIGPSQQVYVVNSSFTDSNGIAPQAGIDIEPATQGSTSQVRIENSVLSNNVGNGLEMHANVSGVVLTKTRLRTTRVTVYSTTALTIRRSRVICLAKIICSAWIWLVPPATCRSTATPSRGTGMLGSTHITNPSLPKAGIRGT